MENEAEITYAGDSSAEDPGNSYNTRRKLSLRKAFHPLLLKKHYDDLQQAKKDVTNSASVN